MVIEVPEVSGQLLLDRTPGEASALVAQRVAAAHEFAAQNMATTDDASEAPLQGVSGEATSLLELAIEKKSLSARGFHRVLKVARTIAYLENQTVIDRSHLAEALAYRAMPLLA